MHHRLAGSALVLGLSLTATSAFAETRTVGAGKQHATLQAALNVVNPGDVVEVYNDETYSGTQDGPWPKRHGKPDAKITIRGMRNAGKRPKLSGGNQWTIIFNAHHYVFEGFEVTGGTQTCIIHKANDITIRDTVVHDCPSHGILGTDDGSGSLTLEYVEVYKCGAERAGDALKHPIYVATDSNPQSGFPGSVFRMQHCWVHDAVHGNNVKSRAERAEIRYNWIEGAGYYEIELIGPDAAPTAAREDSEVIGNVLVKTNTRSTLMRLGGDGTGETKGRYRFLNNTFILAANVDLMRAMDGIESVEFSNNVVYKVGGAPITNFFRTTEAVWVQGQPRISGANNWIPANAQGVPTQFTGTITGTDPGFISASAPFDLRIAETSPLVDKGIATSPAAPNAAFPNPLAAPEFVPTPRAVPPVGKPPKRPKTATVDIGAYEVGSLEPEPETGEADGGGGSSGGAASSGGPNGGGGGGGGAEDSGCGCRVSRAYVGWAAIGALGIAALVSLLRRRR